MKNLIIGTALILTATTTFGEPARSLTVGEGFVNPLGFHEASPVFSWKLPDGVKKQSAYRIEAEAGEKSWDSGWIKSDQSTFVPYGGEPLTSRQQVDWRVRFRDEAGNDSGWSAPAHFELGLLSAKDWKAQWIRPAGDSDPNREAVAWLRRSFSTEKKIARARIYVTARGLFEISLNGTQVGSDHFANGWTSYDKRLDTLTYDVTSQLRTGVNTLQALVGTGWYAGRLTWEKGKKGRRNFMESILSCCFNSKSPTEMAPPKPWFPMASGRELSMAHWFPPAYTTARATMRDKRPRTGSR